MGTAAVIAICVTLLLMCGGVLTFAYMAVDRLAQAIEEIEYDGMDDDDDTPLALEYALGGSDVVDEQVGTISSIQVNDNLTYNIKAENPEYYYDVTGDRGSMVVAVWFDEDEQSERWFQRVARMTKDGELIEELDARPVPFDSALSKLVWDQLGASTRIAEEVGEIRFVADDWEASIEASEEDSDFVNFFNVRGSKGELRVKARFTDFNYDQIDSIVLWGDDGIESPLVLDPKGTSLDGAATPETASRTQP
jgi:hypothetical protein